MVLCCGCVWQRRLLRAADITTGDGVPWADGTGIAITGTGFGISPTGAAFGETLTGEVTTATLTYFGQPTGVNKFGQWMVGRLVPEPNSIALLGIGGLGLLLQGRRRK